MQEKLKSHGYIMLFVVAQSWTGSIPDIDQGGFLEVECSYIFREKIPRYIYSAHWE